MPIRFKAAIKKVLGDSNESRYHKVGDKWLSHHDCCHILISQLPRVRICGELVNGVNGVSIEEFGRAGLPAQYSPYLDECRVGIHQALTESNPCSKVRGAFWCLWLLLKKENPLRVVMEHKAALNG